MSAAASNGSKRSAPRLSLSGRVFAFHGLLRRRRERLTRVLVARDATVLTSWRGAAADELLVLTDYWVDALPTSDASTGCSLHCVTEFWLREVLRTDAWIDPDAHAYFAPPVPRALISYPMDFDPQLQSQHETTHFVMLPCSPHNLAEDVVPLWPYVVAYLHEPTTNTRELVMMLKRINGRGRHSSMNSLQFAIEELLSSADRTLFFDTVLPKLKQLVLDMPLQFRQPLRLLTPIEKSASVTSRETTSETMHLSRSQLLSLLSAMFLTVFPGQMHVANADFPWFNIAEMLSAPRSMGDFVELKAHKIRTILEYFLRIVPRFHQSPTLATDEIVTFTRVAVHVPQAVQTAGPPTALQSLSGRTGNDASVAMSSVRIETNVLIEDLHAHLQIDFANKYAGGGVMNGGCVQEEIRFILSPELLVACLLFAKLEPHESFVIHGSERFSNYTGYGSTYRFADSTQDATPLVAVAGLADGIQRQRRQSVVVGIDAISYGGNNVSRQYGWRCVQRDLVKALVGFAYPDDESRSWPIATGNWGCGVFRGDPELKFVIQWLAASLAQRSSMVYVIFETGSDLESKISTLLSECARVSAATPTPPLAEWMLEFLHELETVADDSPPQQRGLLRRIRGSLTQRRPRSVLERAVAFVRAKASSTVAVGPVSSPVRADPTPSPPRNPVTPRAEASPRPTTPSAVRPRTNSSASPSGPHLKQPKLTAFFTSKPQ